jgi:streptomycin 6-kinase
VTAPGVPELDDELRRRLGRRFGASVESWLDALPPVLAKLAERWRLELGSLVRRGTVSVVIRAGMESGGRAILKLSPDTARIAAEAAALQRWRTPHVPTVLAVDDELGALLLEAIEPGTALDETTVRPDADQLGALLQSLHASGPVAASDRPLPARIGYLFEAGTKNYARRPDLAAVVPRELYERGGELALRLAADAPAAVLLHGDLTPVNILDGGTERGLVAIDPAPCVGDPAFDAVDLVLWRVADVETIVARAQRLARGMRTDADRVVAWCAAFAAMAALELAEGSDDASVQVDVLVEFARAHT